MKELWDKLEDIYYVTDEVDKGVKSVLSDWYREQGDDDFLAHWATVILRKICTKQCGQYIIIPELWGKIADDWYNNLTSSIWYYVTI